eukprot:gb/GEZJ01008597.1/.p1 GENE.gb/GEZJ01008597.1/~~gb/GEZJ01008597.1/.p1  ORF type:complete len:113 (+),score=11.57 gb/GEZJ01008597.1/:691-1029(+)
MISLVQETVVVIDWNYDYCNIFLATFMDRTELKDFEVKLAVTKLVSQVLSGVKDSLRATSSHIGASAVEDTVNSEMFRRPTRFLYSDNSVPYQRQNISSDIENLSIIPCVTL